MMLLNSVIANTAEAHNNAATRLPDQTNITATPTKQMAYIAASLHIIPPSFPEETTSSAQLYQGMVSLRPQSTQQTTLQFWLGTGARATGLAKISAMAIQATAAFYAFETRRDFEMAFQPPPLIKLN